MIFEPTILLKPDAIQVADTARIDSFCKVEGGQGIIIGEYVHIASFCHLNIGGGKLTIGDHAGIASGAKVITGTNSYEGLSMSASSPRDMQVVYRLSVTIETYAFVGANAVILPGVIIGRGAVVGAGAVVKNDVAPYTIVAGVPARIIGMRDTRP